jgi:hypothetical protein
MVDTLPKILVDDLLKQLSKATIQSNYPKQLFKVVIQSNYQSSYKNSKRISRSHLTKS